MSHHFPSSTGRPPATSHAAIENAAFELFADKGFEETTVDDIAEAVGVGRRTLFRYFPSKFDIPWGQFDDSLAGFRELLRAMPPDLPLAQAVQQGVVAFNDFDQASLEQHQTRMTLILRTPSLQAHSVLMYERWRSVIADFVAERRRIHCTDPLPLTVGHVSLALAISAYEQWLSPGSPPLNELLNSTFSMLRDFLSDDT
jgi:mycofactocin system transcriptional regulator